MLDITSYGRFNNQQSNVKKLTDKVKSKFALEISIFPISSSICSQGVTKEGSYFSGG